MELEENISKGPSNHPFFSSNQHYNPFENDYERRNNNLKLNQTPLNIPIHPSFQRGNAINFSNHGQQKNQGVASMYIEGDYSYPDGENYSNALDFAFFFFTN